MEHGLVVDQSIVGGAIHWAGGGGYKRKVTEQASKKCLPWSQPSPLKQKKPEPSESLPTLSCVYFF